MPHITIKQATSDDLTAWLSLRTQLWPVHAGQGHLHEAVRLLRSDKAFASFIARVDGDESAGFVEVAMRSDYVPGCATSPVAFLEGIYVAPPWRRRGVARRLCVEAEAWARRQGCREFASDALIDNSISHRMHAALGFEEIERVVFFRKSL